MTKYDNEFNSLQDRLLEGRSDIVLVPLRIIEIDSMYFFQWIDSASEELAYSHVFLVYKLVCTTLVLTQNSLSTVKLITGSNMDPCILGLRFQQFFGDGEGWGVLLVSFYSIHFDTHVEINHYLL